MQRIAIVGKMHAGKTSTAKLFMDADPNFARLSFAQPLKDVAGKMLTIFMRDVCGRNEPIIIDDKMKGDPIIRQFLQFIGAELGRVWSGNPDVWVDKAKETIERYPSQMYVVDDCRYWNEYRMLKDKEFTFIRVSRDETDRIASIMGELERTMRDSSFIERRDTLQKILAHSSEQHAVDFPVDYTVSADSISELKTKLIQTLGESGCLFTTKKTNGSTDQSQKTPRNLEADYLLSELEFVLNAK